MQRTGKTIPYADCNAISPMTVMAMAEDFAAADIPFVDAGIIGRAPGVDSKTQFYATGAEAMRLKVLDDNGMAVTVLSDRIGDASALKMCFASINKGTNAIYATELIATARYGLGAELAQEIEGRAPAIWQAMNRAVPWLAADADRWTGEMEEIAATYDAVGMPDGFHRGAADLFRKLAATRWATKRAKRWTAPARWNKRLRSWPKPLGRIELPIRPQGDPIMRRLLFLPLVLVMSLPASAQEIGRVRQVVLDAYGTPKRRTGDRCMAARG